MPASNSPERIVGNHVLLRLCVPRYPPSALCSLTTSINYIGVCDTHPCSLTQKLINKNYLPDKFLCSFQGSDWTKIQQAL
jgi:hypothetical protein